MTESSPSTSESSLKIYLRLLSYVRPYVGLFLLSILGFLIFASTQPMLGYILKYFVDGLSNPDAVLFPTVPYLRDLRLLQVVPILIVLIAAWQGLGSFLGNYFLAKVSLGLVHDLRVQLFNNLLVLPNRYFDKHNSGHLISRITFNVTMVTGAATDAIKVVIREGMTVVFLFVGGYGDRSEVGAAIRGDRRGDCRVVSVGGAKQAFLPPFERSGRGGFPGPGHVPDRRLKELTGSAGIPVGTAN